MISDKDMVELSTLHAYAYYEKGKEFIVNDNTYYVVDIYSEKNGMKHGTDAFLVRNDSEEYALIYTGSDKRNDFVNDWVLNNGRNLFQISPPQYEEGLDLYNSLSNNYDISRVGGVSLGGGVSTYVGIANPTVSVVSINPAPQTFSIDKEYENIITIVDRNDILFNASSIAGRRNNYTKSIYFFDRGNDFLKNIKLNHIGYDKKLDVYLDDSIPFDLLTGNLNSSYIDIDATDINTINNNLSIYLDNQSSELDVKVMPVLKDAVSNYRDNISYQVVMNSVIDQVYYYMINTLPTLNSYFEFSHFFDEIKSLVNNQSYLVLDNILSDIIDTLQLDLINKQIYTDSVNGISNFMEIKTFVQDVSTGCDTLINNISLKDVYASTNNTPVINSIVLNKNNSAIKLTYFVLFEYAKKILYSKLKSTINAKFAIIDTKIDVVVYSLKNTVGLVGDIVGIISKDISKKIEVVEQILKELYIFDIADAVYNIFIICIEEIISIVLPKKLNDKLSAFKYFAHNLSNSQVIYENYRSYLQAYKSNGLSKIINSFSIFENNFIEYKNYLNNNYN